MCFSSEGTASSLAVCGPAPLCTDAQADDKSFVEMPAIAAIDDAGDRKDR
jgi:hypothetical protein